MNSNALHNILSQLPAGFIGCHTHLGLREQGDDCLLIGANTSVTSSALFTQSLFAGPSVTLSRTSMQAGPLQGLIVIAKNANVANGIVGEQHARALQAKAAALLKLAPEQVLVASTGVIGRIYPFEQMLNKLNSKPLILEPLALEAAARTIMTTDTKPKFARKTKDGVTVAAIAKGVGMIEPNMATMLSFFFTDAAIPSKQLEAIFKRVVDKSFNSLSIDTDTSTSDTAAVFASGLVADVDLDSFEQTCTELAIDLVRQIAGDGEGATKIIEVQVTGGRDHAQSKRVAKAIVNSPLVKTAIHGSDPNWGRIVMAIGKLHTESDISPNNITISFGDIPVYPPQEQTDNLDFLASYLKRRLIVINVALGIAQGESCVYGCDLSAEYIRINADYTT